MILLCLCLITSMLLAGVVLSRPSFYDKNTLYFSLPVAPGFGKSDIGQKVFRKFTGQLWIAIATAVGLLSIALAIPPHATVQLLPGYAIGYTLFMVLYFRAHKKARETVMPYMVEPNSKRRARLDLQEEDNRKRHLILLPAYFIVLAATAVVFLYWDQAPERFAVRWNFAGEEVAWREKSVFSVLKTSLGVLALMSFLHFCFSPQYRSRGGLKRIPFGISIMFLYGMAGIFSLNVLVPVLHVYWAEGTVIPVLISITTVLIVLVILIVSVLVLEKKAEDSLDMGTSVFDDPKYWRNGFYYNPDDPTLFVEKPCGCGFTLNLGRPRAKWLLAGAIIYFLATLLLVN